MTRTPSWIADDKLGDTRHKSANTRDLMNVLVREKKSSSNAKQSLALFCFSLSVVAFTTSLPAFIITLMVKKFSSFPAKETLVRYKKGDSHTTITAVVGSVVL